MQIVTGAAGFIGSNLVRCLNVRGGGDVLAVDAPPSLDECPNLRGVEVSRYMERSAFLEAVKLGDLPKSIDAVYHQGACADTMETDERYMMSNNRDYSKELLTFALRRRIPFVYASSASVYGGGEHSREDASNENPLNLYARSKLEFDNYVRSLPDSVDTAVVGLRYFNVYGPRELHKGRMASMPYQIYRQLADTGVCRLFEGTDGYEDGEQRRDFVHVGDACKVNMHFSEAGDVQGVFNVAPGASRSFNDIASILISLLGEGRIEYIPFPKELQGKYQSFTEADLTNLRAAGCDVEFASLEEGLALSAGEWAKE